EAVNLFQGGRAEEAEPLLLSALEIFETHDGADSPDVAAVLCDLGTIAEERCDYELALERFRRAAEIIETISDSDDEDLRQLCLRVWNSLGQAQRLLGCYSQSKPFYHRALEFAERIYGAESIEVADALNNLGILGKFAGWFDEAEQHYRRSLAIVEKLFGVDSPRAASLYHNLGGLAHARGQFAEGEPFARKAVELRRRKLGVDHPAVAHDMAALAALLDGQGKYDESEPIY